MSAQTASVQVFGKGFRVSTDSEEFQRLVPKDSSALRATLERKLGDYKNWGSTLEPLYSTPTRDVPAQFCVLLASEEIMALAFALTEDIHKRPSVVVVTATVSISWEDPDLASAFDQSVGLASRLAAEYGQIFAKDHVRVGNQLARGTFLGDRNHELQTEKSTVSVDWKHVVRAIREWQGINGIATSRLAPLGANIVTGTRHEAEKANGRGSVDGYFDVREQEIVALNDNLKRWPKPTLTEPLPKRANVEAHNGPSLESIDASLKGIDTSLRRMSNTVEAIYQMVHDYIFTPWRGGRGPR